MELQFPKKELDCLKTAVWEIKNEEHTQEVRLTDAMPDAGYVLGCWGQVLIRSKEWRGSSMNISGGVMAWVLYAPEDGSAPRSVETWIPFQTKWDLVDSRKDGQILINGLLRSLDARLVSARKLMLRACLSVMGRGLEPGKLEVYAPGELPEDIYVLKKNYPVQIPVEAGEKTFFVEEALSWPAGVGPVDKMIHYCVLPEILDKKVMADKAVFRGSVHVHALCCCADGQLKNCDFEIGFSQFAYLSREYDPRATVSVVPAVSSLELEMGEDGHLGLKAGIIGQYVICDHPVLEVVEDAYSVSRSVALKMGQLEPGSILEEKQEMIKAEMGNVESPLSEIVDISLHVEHPVQKFGENGSKVEFEGMFQVLGRNDEGILESQMLPWEHTMPMPSDEDAVLKGACMLKGLPQAFVSPTGVHLQGDVQADILAISREKLPMATGLEIGEAEVKDPGRPSLILRRASGDGLWSLAKQCGSTMDVIRAANHLTEDPAEGQLLLIPVL